MTIIEIKDLYKEYEIYEREGGLKSAIISLFTRKTKKVKALNGINITVNEGEFVGLIGPNGAGKSTLIKILSGILFPTSGEVKMNGIIPYEQREKNARNIGVMFGQRSNLWWDLPVIDTFELLKEIYEIPDSEYEKNIKEFSKLLAIDKYLKTPVRKLSLGERMRCEVAACLLHNPKIVFLDEPTIGLDVVAKQRIREFLKMINKKRRVTIILTTHDVGDIERLCKRIIIIDKGNKVYDGELERLMKRFRKLKTVTFRVSDPNISKSKLESLFKEKIKNQKIKILSKENEEIKFEINSNKVNTSEFVKEALNKLPVVDFKIDEPEIEEIIREIYKKGIVRRG
jgi:ABC-2 type transport system ATP-binding protein